jgi:hypothetical protein
VDGDPILAALVAISSVGAVNAAAAVVYSWLRGRVRGRVVAKDTATGLTVSLSEDDLRNPERVAAIIEELTRDVQEPEPPTTTGADRPVP